MSAPSQDLYSYNSYFEIKKFFLENAYYLEAYFRLFSISGQPTLISRFFLGVKHRQEHFNFTNIFLPFQNSSYIPE